MDEKTLKAIQNALKRGERVEIKQMKDGTVKVQTVSRKELKT